MGMDLILVSKKVIEALFVGISGIVVHTQSPFPDGSCYIPRLLQHMTYGEAAFGKGHRARFHLTFKGDRPVIVPHKCVPCMSSCEKHTAGRSANRAAGIMLGKTNTLTGQIVQMGSFDLVLTITSQFTISHII